MSVCGDDFLKSANDCLHCDNEIGYRNSVSRCYYGMYHKAHGILKNIPNFSSNHHQGLISYLSEPAKNKNEPYDKSSLKSLAYILRQERDRRNHADYNLLKDFTKADVMANQAACKKFSQKIDELLEEK